MSLVNQMLKDLEQRRAQLPPGDSLRGLHAAPNAAAPARRWPVALLAIALAGSGFGIWLAQSSITLLPDIAPLQPPQTQVPPMAAQNAKPDVAVTPVRAEAGTTVIATAASADTAPAHDVNAAEYAVDPDAEWDREWLTGMNEAVSVAALEEHLAEDASATPPPAGPPKVKTAPEKPAPKPSTAPNTALAAAATGSMHKTPRAEDPQTQAAQHYATAVTALRNGDTRAAENALHAAVRAAPGHGAATQALAALLLQQGRRGEAETVLADALAANPQQPALIVLRARLLAESGRDREAVELLKARDDAESLALLGALHQRLGDDGAAAQAYRRALANAPQQGAWWLGLAISLERAQQPRAALEAYRRALADTRLDAQVNDYVRARIAALGSDQG